MPFDFSPFFRSTQRVCIAIYWPKEALFAKVYQVPYNLRAIFKELFIF